MVTLGVYNDGIYNLGIFNLAVSGTNASISLDGKSQYLGIIEPSHLGIGNTWTIGFWAKPLDNPEHTSFFSTASHTRLNEIGMSTTPISPETQMHGRRPSSLQALIKDASGTTIKHYGWGGFFKTDTWTHVFVQWNGVQLNAFNNGQASTTGVVFVTTTGIMSDSPDRRLFYGAAVGGIMATFSGTLGHLGMWNSILSSAEMQVVVSGGFEIDLTVPSGSYVSTSSLQHYWRPGADPDNLGQDHAGTLNLDKQRNLDSSSAVSDEP